jgi:hypothetical protein
MYNELFIVILKEKAILLPKTPWIAGKLVSVMELIEEHVQVIMLFEIEQPDIVFEINESIFYRSPVEVRM